MQCMKMHTLKKANNNYKHNQVVVQSRGILLIVSFQICRNHKKERKKERKNPHSIVKTLTPFFLDDCIVVLPWITC
jgi:hypothetical protein